MSSKLALLAALIFAPAAQAGQGEPTPPAPPQGPHIWLYVDRGDCYKGHSKMNVSITVDSEPFRYSPSCRRVFVQSFTTQSGASCQISSEMCSGDAARGRIQATCTGSDGTVSTDEDSFSCPQRRR